MQYPAISTIPLACSTRSVPTCRPIGALIFGHIGDTKGRNRCLLISICCMAFATIAIGVLPTFAIAPYAAGVAAPVLLALCRILQGLAMGGEFGSAVIYISELAHKDRRGAFVATLQMSVNVGMVVATLLVMLLQNTLSLDAMLAWGWRIPFLCAFVTALLGAALRSTMPEPKAFLTAARLAKLRSTADGGDAADKAVGSCDPSTLDMDVEVATNKDPLEKVRPSATRAWQRQCGGRPCMGGLTHAHASTHISWLALRRVHAPLPRH
jgi:MFS family permease